MNLVESDFEHCRLRTAQLFINIHNEHTVLPHLTSVFVTAPTFLSYFSVLNIDMHGANFKQPLLSVDVDVCMSSSGHHSGDVITLKMFLILVFLSE